MAYQPSRQAPPGRPYVIGLTGNIASGKSAVRQMLEELGAEGIDADGLVHQLLEPSGAAYEAVRAAFGEAIPDGQGRIDRRALGRIVFARPEALRRLEAILHPLVREEVGRRIERSRAPVIVVEAVRLVEAGMHAQLDALWLVEADRSAQAGRLRDRGLSQAEIETRLAAQPPLEGKRELASVIIHNSGELDDTRRQAEEAWHETLSGRA